MFLNHILHLRQTYLKTEGLTVRVSTLQYRCAQSSKFRTRFYGMNIDMVLAVDCGATGLTLKRSLIFHLIARLLVFAPRKFGR